MEIRRKYDDEVVEEFVKRNLHDITEELRKLMKQFFKPTQGKGQT